MIEICSCLSVSQPIFTNREPTSVLEVGAHSFLFWGRDVRAMEECERRGRTEFSKFPSIKVQFSRTNERDKGKTH